MHYKITIVKYYALITALFGGLWTFGQGSTSYYGTVDTLKVYSFSSGVDYTVEPHKYKINGKEVDEATFKQYSEPAEGIKNCKPYYLKVFSVDEVQISESLSYTDLTIGPFKEYDEEGKLALVGEMDLSSEKVKEKIKDGKKVFRLKRVEPKGKWVYFKPNGAVDKEEVYVNGSLKTKKED